MGRVAACYTWYFSNTEFQSLMRLRKICKQGLYQEVSFISCYKVTSSWSARIILRDSNLLKKYTFYWYL